MDLLHINNHQCWMWLCFPRLIGLQESILDLLHGDTS